MTMTIKFPALMMLALLAAASTASAQSANRSASGTPAAPARVETPAPAPEHEAISRCRAHCDAVTVSGPHAIAPRQSAAERQARQSHCARRMA
jgi:curli biogenesis system outer membrane secretion channel CsgG